MYMCDGVNNSVDRLSSVATMYIPRRALNFKARARCLPLGDVNPANPCYPATVREPLLCQYYSTGKKSPYFFIHRYSYKINYSIFVLSVFGTRSRRREEYSHYRIRYSTKVENPYPVLGQAAGGREEYSHYRIR
jgi:hypothetical protein